ncbi:MAG: amidohydrolase family protein [Clostridia bacterium]|nr:amidohydrolase family protein [Clostridia bacterium]
MDHIKVLLGRIIDSVGEEAIEDGAVVIENEKITYAGPRDRAAIPADAAVFTCENATIMAGFIDAHIHLVGSESIHKSGDTPYDLLLTTVKDLCDLVDAGVTGVRDMSAFGRPLRDAIARGNIKGPRIMVGGRVLSMSSGHCDFDVTKPVSQCNDEDLTGFMMDGPEDCYKGVRRQFREGAEFIKICATGGVSSAIDDVNDQEFSEEELRVIIGEAKRHNTYVTAHCTGTAGTKAALKAGIGCVEHGVMLDEECCEIMQKNNVPLVTTLSVSLGIADMKNLPPHMMRKAQGVKEHAMHSYQLAHAYGITVALGTDYSNSPNTPFHGIGREFYSLTRCGYTPMEAIKAGTVNGARLMRRDREIGTVEAGKLADLVLVQGDPLRDIRVLEDADNVKMVLIGGAIQKQMPEVRNGL